MDIDSFKKAKMQAMKEKDKVKVGALELVISKLMLTIIDKRAKNETVNENDSIAVLQKSVKELEEEKLGFEQANRPEKIEVLTQQIAILKALLPTMLSIDEIKAIIEQLPDKSVPAIMKHFKSNYQGKCNMKDVNDVVKTL